ncbi:MAG TPA: methyltransferase domain-containing protein [Firmicutes bacterium]|nr:methyltransferase domain-containing protein [Bacillota bacterium]
MTHRMPGASSTYWSEYVQEPEELYCSRALRFREDNKDAWLRLIGAGDGMRILEVGCGSGLFCHRLAAFLPHASVTGLDRDAGHLHYAAGKARETGLRCRFVQGDALALPFEEDAFDLCYSYTVMNFCDPSAFLAEQRRVLRPGGRIAVLNVIGSGAPEAWLPTDGHEEKALFDRLWQAAADVDPLSRIPRHPWSVEQTCRLLAGQGFQGIAVDVLAVVSHTPDSADVSEEEAAAQINENRTAELCSAAKARRMAPEALSDKEYRDLQEKINRRYDRRPRDYRQGIPHWECEFSTVAAITGQKPAD